MAMLRPLVLLLCASACQISAGGLGGGDGQLGTTGAADETTAGTAAASTADQTSAVDADGDSGSGSTATATDEGDTTAGPADCTRDNGGCDPNATCDDRSGAVECTCNPGYEGDGQRCSVAASLPTLRIEVPCGAGSCGSAYCDAINDASDLGTLSGDPSVTFSVTLRLRGVVEEKEYSGGVSDGFWNEGGTPADDPWNVYALTISDPPQEYFLNAGAGDVDYCTAIDYQQTVSVQGSAELALTMSDSNQCATINEDQGGQPIVIPEIPPAPEPFDGQFVQLDVVDIVPVP